MLPLLVLLFVLSGAAGLGYESIWTRYLALFVGHSAYAQMLVLAIFLGGMSIGALAVGRRAERIRDPLLAYALIEALIGVMGVGFHAVYRGATGMAYEQWFPALAGTPWLHPLQWTLAGLLILPQSILLGATFPLISAAVLRRKSGPPGQLLAVLYFANSMGAAAGALIAGFVLVSWVGLPGTVAAAGLTNMLVAAVVMVARARERRAPVVEPAPTPVPAAGPPRRDRSARPPSPAIAPMQLLLGIAFGTAVASFCYEIAWIRLLSLMMGSATHAFEIMLSAFILGLALGAAWVRPRVDRFRQPLRALGWIQCAMGLCVLATLPVAAAGFGWVAALIHVLPLTGAGYLGFGVARYGIALAVMLPATFCAGMTLPLITRLGLERPHGEGSIGLVYGANTLGSILGAVLAGMVLMPWLGLKGVLITGAAIDLGLGAWAMRAHDRLVPAPAQRSWSVALGCGVALVVASAWHFDRVVLTSGVYRHGLLLSPDTTDVPFYHDGRTASVAIRRHRSSGWMTLTINGKPDAAMGPNWLRPPAERQLLQLVGDEPTQIGLAMLALAHAPHARRAAVVGQGSGVTTHLLLGAPWLERVVTIEIEPEVIAASRAFYPANRRVFEDPRSTIVLDDARAYLSSAGERWGLIVSEPSNPCVSGVAGLFTTEFYALVSRHLTTDGVLVQWLHLYELNDDQVLGVLGALQRNFRHYDVFMLDATDLAIVATNAPPGLAPDWLGVMSPGVVEDLHHVPPYAPDVFEAMRAGGRALLAPLVSRAGIVNSDFHPVLDLGAERARFLRTTARGFAELNADRYSLATVLGGRRLGFAGTPFVPSADLPRWRERAIGAAVRAGMPPRGDYEREMSRAYERARRVATALTSSGASPDWHAWTDDALSFEQDVHGGTAGVADEAFYAPLLTAARARGAPDSALTALALAHALARWDFPAAVACADTLIDYAVAGDDWMDPDRLLDGGVAAHLALGDPAGAARVAARLGLRSRRRPGDLRTRLREALISNASSTR